MKRSIRRLGAFQRYKGGVSCSTTSMSSIFTKSPLWSIAPLAVSVGVIILGILIYFVILGFITANPQKDDAQLNIDKMDEQIQKLQERHEILQRRFDEEQMNIQNINRIGSRLEQLQQIKPEEIIPLLIEAGKYY